MKNPQDIAEIVAMPINDRASAEAFIARLHSLGLSYHFDDGAVDCLHGNNLCTVEEAEAIEEQVNECHRMYEWAGADLNVDCPIGYLLTLLEAA